MNANLVDAKSMARLARVAQRKTRVALMGEFSAGKSTLLNLFLAKDIAKTQVTATHIPAIWFHKGTEKNHVLFDYDGYPYEKRKPSKKLLDIQKCAMARIETENPALDRCDFIDTPGISDPMMTNTPLGLIARRSDFVIWCTTAVQAWRQSEVSVWDGLPKRLYTNSILAITGIDRLCTDDQKKVLGRVEKEAAGRFRAVVAIASLDAVRALKIGNNTEGKELWRTSGGAALLRELDTSITSADLRRREMLQRYEVDPVDTPAAPLKLSPETKNDCALATWDKIAKAAHTQNELRSAIADFKRDRNVNPTLDALLSLPDQIDDLPATKFQLRGEIEAFSQAVWCDLAPS